MALELELEGEHVRLIRAVERAIEARTMDTGVPIYTAPADARRSDLERIDRERNAYLQKVAAIRQQSVAQSMAQGYVLTQYFYNQLGAFEHGPTSLKESIGEMVYGMDVDRERHKDQQIAFLPNGSHDVLRRATQLGPFIREEILRQLKQYGEPIVTQEPTRYNIDGRPAFITLASVPRPATSGNVARTTYAAKACVLGSIPARGRAPRSRPWRGCARWRRAGCRG